MTEQQFEDIKSRLKKWREDRWLSVEDQQKHFKVNYVKELLEFFEAERDNNKREMIDALCDMVIVAINSGKTLGDWHYSIKNETFDISFLTYVLNDNADCELILYALKHFGYDPYLCLLETIKELETRTGSWNEKEGKWCKDVGAYTAEEALKKALEHHTLTICEDLETTCNLVSERSAYFDSEYFVCVVRNGVFAEYVKVKKWYKADYSKCKLEDRNVGNKCESI